MAPSSSDLIAKKAGGPPAQTRASPRPLPQDGGRPPRRAAFLPPLVPLAVERDPGPRQGFTHRAPDLRGSMADPAGEHQRLHATLERREVGAYVLHDAVA